MGGSGPVPPGLVLAKGEFCCLFILVLSSTCDTKGAKQASFCFSVLKI